MVYSWAVFELFPETEDNNNWKDYWIRNYNKVNISWALQNWPELQFQIRQDLQKLWQLDEVIDESLKKDVKRWSSIADAVMKQILPKWWDLAVAGFVYYKYKELLEKNWCREIWKNIVRKQILIEFWIDYVGDLITYMIWNKPKGDRKFDKNNNSSIKWIEWVSELAATYFNRMDKNIAGEIWLIKNDLSKKLNHQWLSEDDLKKPLTTAQRIKNWDIDTLKKLSGLPDGFSATYWKDIQEKIDKIQIIYN